MKKDCYYCFNLDIQAEKQPHKKAIISDHDAISYLELQESSCRAARALLDKGMKPGDTILIFMPNSIEYAVVFFAAARLRLNITLANALYKDSELGPLIQTTQPKLALVMNDKEAKLLHTVNSKLPAVCVPSFMKSFRDGHIEDNEVSLCTPDFEQACIYISTSGSTGSPKVVSNSYESERINAELYVDRLKVTEKDVILTALPATQRFGMAAMLGGCIKGATVVLTSKFRAATVLSLIKKCHVTVQYGVPTMFLKEIETFESADTAWDISSLRTGVVAGANCPEEIFRWFETHAGCRLLNCYGTSEIGGLTMVKYDDPDDIRYHTCGQALRDAVIEITDHKGHVLAAGETGDIICRVPWIMNGYVGESEVTEQMFNEKGFFQTGDFGSLDKDGHLIIVGRKKDMIIRGGYNIFPIELEQSLMNHPGVAEACVMGYQDPIMGERIFAFIKPANDSVREESIRQMLAQHLAKYKLPDHILFLEKIPKLPNGKFDYPSLKAFLRREGCVNSETVHS